MTLEQLVQDPTALWTRRDPVSASIVEQLGAALRALPADYLAFLALSNGGEGEIGLQLGWFQLWPAEAVVEMNNGYQVGELLPGYLAFGSNGGGEMLAFAPGGAVVMVPFLPMDVAEARELAPSFTSLVRAFGRGAHEL
jgi:hypothetical protein